VGEATGPLLQWLERSTFPEEARFADPGHARAVAAVFVRALLRAGTTGACVYGPVFAHAVDALFEAAAEGPRLLAGPVWMDQDCPEALRVPANRAADDVVALAERWHRPQGRTQIAVIPRFALTCSAGMLRTAANLADARDLHVTTHLAETPDECALAASRAGAPDYLAVYERAGLVGPRTVLAHCIHLDGDSWDRIAASGASVAHCPDSNAFLGSGGMPVAEPLRRGIHIGLGSDVAAGRSFRGAMAAAHAWDNARRQGVDLRPERLLWWATAGAAACLGWPHVGRIAPGQASDLQLRPVPPWADTQDRVLAALLFDADAPPPVAVWVDGRPAWADDGRPWWAVVG
jgi:guanine deaminase